jgi:hypothetical protein
MTPPVRNVNPSTFVVIGDGLAAGAGDFGLSEELQPFSFPAQIAHRLATPFPQPVMEAPGIGPVIGLPDLPVRLPQAMQTTVLKEFPPDGPFANLAIPGLTLADSLTRRPTSPVIHRSDNLQTAINLILGIPGLLTAGSGPLPTQLEYAVARQPTLALVALGYFDVLGSAFTGNLSLLPAEAAFRANYASLLRPFAQMPTTVIVCTIPDPNDTAYFTPVSAAARVVKADPAVLSMLFQLTENDALTPTGLVEVGCRLIARAPSPLPDGSVVPGRIVEAISERVQALNTHIRALADEHGALVCDLHGLCRRIKREGLAVGSRTLTADYLGGVYSLNGVYPGATGHGAIANSVIELLNTTCGTSYLPVDLAELAAWDPVAAYRLAEGPAVTLSDVAAMPPPAAAPQAPTSEPLSVPTTAPAGRLTLPAGLEQELPISFDGSYVGDAQRVTHTREERDIPFGSTPNTLFGGLCLSQSHLRGTLRIRFTAPQGDITHFEVTHGEGLTGSDTVVSAPQWYKLPAIMNTVTDLPGVVSSGDLNLETGEVSNLTYTVVFRNSALFALVSVNPKLPPTPIMFPGQYGSAWARFEQRADGKLDFSFSGVTFMPLGAGFGGDELRFPLPFAGPAMSFASVPGVGTALHPHLRISTKAPEANAHGEVAADIPTNTIREYTAFVHNNAFGDKFSLNIPELGGSATGRSHLLGRVHVQFGERSGNTVPIAVSSLVPGGMLAKPAESLIGKMFPGRLSFGFLAHDERLHYPNVHYDMHGVRWADDPFELSVGSVDVRTGRVVGNLLFRGFIVQNVIQTLLMIEPRTPKSSWLMRGGAAFHRDPSGQTVFGFGGADRIPYPEGYAFPQSDLKGVYYAGPNSQLDPYIYLQAMEGFVPPPAGKSGSAERVSASNGQRFSYSYAIPGGPSSRPAAFEYRNETTGGAFRMDSLVWVSFSNSNGVACAGECEVVTFTGIGVWDLDPSTPRLATVQISTAPDLPYVTIQIDGGVLSNVNTKPPKTVLPLSWATVPLS